MINELHQLSVAMEDAGIDSYGWHDNYKEIPKIRKKTPCIRIVIADGKIKDLVSLDENHARVIRKYEKTNGQSFPAMNLCPLYKIDDESVRKTIELFSKSNGNIESLSAIRECCRQNNWLDDNLKKKYAGCMVRLPSELRHQLSDIKGFDKFAILLDEVEKFSDPQKLHDELFEAVMNRLESKQDMDLAMFILFDFASSGKKTNVSFVVDSEKLEDNGIPVTNIKFTKLLNSMLLEKMGNKSIESIDKYDAFGFPFETVNEKMPSVKLAGGFDVSLRTMFHDHICQYRYGEIEDGSYPISKNMRSGLKKALEWISSDERHNKTWIEVDTKEIMFVYPSRIPKVNGSILGVFRQQKKDNVESVRFVTMSESFVEYICKIKQIDPEHYPESIRIFILKKIDKARTKVKYTKLTTPEEVIYRCEIWQNAMTNLPNLYLGKTNSQFPLNVSAKMNTAYNYNGVMASGSYKPFDSYHGLELFFGVPDAVYLNDIHVMVENIIKVAPYIGSKVIDEKGKYNALESLTIISMLLYWLGERKENYMNEYPYLLGQMLQASDKLHELYCKEVRKGSMPNQLVGSSMFVAATEMPVRTLAQLSVRMNPYLSWAKVSTDKPQYSVNENEENNEKKIKGPKAGYLLWVYKQIADNIGELDLSAENKRFTDIEKAELFIGYMASLPKNKVENNQNQ